MDLRPIPGAVATAEERAAVDAVLGPPASGWEGGERRMEAEGHSATGGQAARGRRHLLLPALQAAQARVGWISPGALDYVCRRLTVPPAEAYGVATFYTMLSVEPAPKTVLHVCDDIACRTRGAKELCADLERRIGPAATPSAGGAATWHRSPCLGQCERAPAILVQAAGEDAIDEVIAPADTAGIAARLGMPPGAAGTGAAGPGMARVTGPGSPTRGPRDGSPSAPQTLHPRTAAGLRILRRIGRVDPASLDDYRAHGGYEALRRAIELGPEGVIREVTDSRLMGRGGAAFPTGRKWEAVARAPVRPHHLVCNADESEPGTFKDRVLLEEDPFAIVEAMTIAALATGCDRGWVYVRGEYPLAAARMAGAITAARGRGLLGSGIMGASFAFDIEVRRGGGAYICGEETALFNSIEGYRGEPRNKPPFPVQAGLFGLPTVINSVETFANVPGIILEGGPAFAAIGTAASTGTKLFCLSGDVVRPGVYETPFGATLREVLDLAGGVAGGAAPRAILLGGSAGSFLTAGDLDMPLTFEGLRANGASLGSGVVMVFDHRHDLADIVLRIAAFFRDESCGQCVPCRVGTQRQEELLRRLAAGRPLGPVDREMALLEDIARVMRDASICGLGQTASGAVLSAIRRLGVFGDAGGTEGRGR